MDARNTIRRLSGKARISAPVKSRVAMVLFCDRGCHDNPDPTRQIRRQRAGCRSTNDLKHPSLAFYSLDSNSICVTALMFIPDGDSEIGQMSCTEYLMRLNENNTHRHAERVGVLRRCLEDCSPWVAHP